MNRPDDSLNPQLHVRTGAEPDPFEATLIRAFASVDAPEGFAGRVLARAAEEASAAPTVLAMPSPRRRRSLYAVAAMLLFALLLTGIGVEHRRQERLREQRDFDTALAVTSRVLDRTRAQLARSGIDLNQ